MKKVFLIDQKYIFNRFKKMSVSCFLWLKCVIPISKFFGFLSKNMAHKRIKNVKKKKREMMHLLWFNIKLYFWAMKKNYSAVIFWTTSPQTLIAWVFFSHAWWRYFKLNSFKQFHTLWTHLYWSAALIKIASIIFYDLKSYMLSCLLF